MNHKVVWDHSLEPPFEADWKSVLTDKTYGGGLTWQMLGRAVPEMGSDTALSQLLGEKKANPTFVRAPGEEGACLPSLRLLRKHRPFPGHLEGGLEPR